MQDRSLLIRPCRFAKYFVLKSASLPQNIKGHLYTKNWVISYGVWRQPVKASKIKTSESILPNKTTRLPFYS